MEPITEDLIGLMSQVIVDTVNPHRIILFGSHARGAAGTGSDVDLLVVVDQPFQRGRGRRTLIARIRQALSRFRVPKDVLVYTTDEMAEWRGSLNHIVSHCLREGKLVYERPEARPADAEDGAERPQGSAGHDGSRSI